MSPAAGRWLVAALTTGVPPARAGNVPRDLLPAAELHGIPGVVQELCSGAGLEVPGLRDAVRSAVARHHRALADLALVGGALGAVGVGWLVVKGPVLAEMYYLSPGLRSSVDLDVLVAPDDLSRAVKAFEAVGFRVLDGNWPLLLAQRVHELRLVAPTGGAVDLHWSLVPPGLPEQGWPSVRQLLADGAGCTLRGRPARTLSWPDTVAHLAVHAASSGGHRLVWTADLRRVLDADHGQGWGAVEAAATRWHSRPAVHLMLLRARRTTGLAVPADVLARLAPSRSWRRLAEAVERLTPFERVGTSRSPSRLLARACREDSRASWAELLRRAGSAGSLVATHDLRVPSPSLDPHHPGSGLFRVGGDREREQFFEVVRAQS